LSVVIPAYNEEHRLPATLGSIREYFAGQPFPVEVIVVDDGSADRTSEVCRAYRDVKVLRNDRNCGKGYSVRRGMLEATGEYILFSDADLAAPIAESAKLLGALRTCDVAIGSRGLPQSRVVRESPGRELLSQAFNRFVRLVTGLPYADTQCGFKAFRRDAARLLFQSLRCHRFSFDVEVLLAARHLGLRVVEVPIEWHERPGSRVNPWRDGWHMMRDVVRLRLTSQNNHGGR
ncbi:MAG: glycosyltransferase family 2 protein, partial [Firmicutes bacterium]|nr:glycosyltransferase family 2 protein [Bacillota bacterium]